MQVPNLCRDTGGIRRNIRTLSKLLDTPSVKRLGRYILELKQHRENDLQSVNHNPFTTHQHGTSVIFQEQGETMNVDVVKAWEWEQLAMSLT